MEKDISSINDDFKIQKIEWPVKRIFWLLMGIFLIAGLLGVFGDSIGLLNEKTIHLSGTTVKYHRFMRVEKKLEMKVKIEDTTIKDCSISLNKNYIDKVQITQIIPDPKEVEINDRKIIYRFNSFHGGTITFYKDPHRMGKQLLELEVNGEKVSVSQFIYF
jgi:hypothetical protein